MKMTLCITNQIYDFSNKWTVMKKEPVFVNVNAAAIVGWDDNVITHFQQAIVKCHYFTYNKVPCTLS